MSVSRRHALESGVAFGATMMIDRTAAAGVVSGQAGQSGAKSEAPLLTLEDDERAARARALASIDRGILAGACART